MICPKCKELGEKSRVYGGTGMTTCAYYTPYWDEEGVYHHHDGNRHTYSYNCSNGHSITVTGTGKCPNCNWGHDNEEVTVKDIEINNFHLQGTSGIIKIKND